MKVNVPETFCRGCNQLVQIFGNECPNCHTILRRTELDTTQTYITDQESGNYESSGIYVGNQYRVGFHSINNRAKLPVAVKQNESKQLRSQSCRKQALKLLTQYCNKLGIDSSYQQQLKGQLEVMSEGHYTQKRWMEVVCGVTVFIVARQNGIAITYDEISRVVGMDAQKFKKFLEEICEEHGLIVTRLPAGKLLIDKIYNEVELFIQANENEARKNKKNGFPYNDIQGLNGNGNGGGGSGNGGDHGMKNSIIHPPPPSSELYLKTIHFSELDTKAKNDLEDVIGSVSSRFQFGRRHHDNEEKEEKEKILRVAEDLVDFAGKEYFLLGRKPAPACAAALYIAINYFGSFKIHIDDISQCAKCSVSTVKTRHLEIMKCIRKLALILTNIRKNKKIEQSHRENGFQIVNKLNDVTNEISPRIIGTIPDVNEFFATKMNEEEHQNGTSSSSSSSTPTTENSLLFPLSQKKKQKEGPSKDDIVNVLNNVLYWRKVYIQIMKSLKEKNNNNSRTTSSNDDDVATLLLTDTTDVIASIINNEKKKEVKEENDDDDDDVMIMKVVKRDPMDYFRNHSEFNVIKEGENEIIEIKDDDEESDDEDEDDEEEENDDDDGEDEEDDEHNIIDELFKKHNSSNSSSNNNNKKKKHQQNGSDLLLSLQSKVQFPFLLEHEKKAFLSKLNRSQKSKIIQKEHNNKKRKRKDFEKQQQQQHDDDDDESPPQKKRKLNSGNEEEIKRRKRSPKIVMNNGKVIIKPIKPPRSQKKESLKWKIWRREKLKSAKIRMFHRFHPLKNDKTVNQPYVDIDDEDRKIERLIMECSTSDKTKKEIDQIYRTYIDTGKTETKDSDKEEDPKIRNKKEKEKEESFTEEVTESDLTDEALFRDYIIPDEELELRNKTKTID